MKYLKLLPLLIAAAFAVPRAHASTGPVSAEAENRDVNAGVLLVGLGVLCLARPGRKSELFKAKSEL